MKTLIEQIAVACVELFIHPTLENCDRVEQALAELRHMLLLRGPTLDTHKEEEKQ